MNASNRVWVALVGLRALASWSVPYRRAARVSPRLVLSLVLAVSAVVWLRHRAQRRRVRHVRPLLAYRYHRPRTQAVQAQAVQAVLMAVVQGRHLPGCQYWPLWRCSRPQGCGSQSGRCDATSVSFSVHLHRSHLRSSTRRRGGRCCSGAELGLGGIRARIIRTAPLPTAHPFRQR